MSVVRGPGWTATISAMFWSMIQPLLDFGSYISSFVTGRRDNNQPEAPPPEQSTPSEQPLQPEQPSRPPY